MGRRVLLAAIPVTLIAFFVAVMLSAGILKRPTGTADDVEAWLSQVEERVIAERWDDALEGAERLASAWRKVAGRIQFSAERLDMLDFRTAIARATGSIKVRDGAGVVVELAEARALWARIGGRY
ncbi:MAG: hypothetical protein VB144_10215 [Clostridia bacterium]|nr:hypothetical protein [Clostridia bacterium]